MQITIDVPELVCSRCNKTAESKAVGLALHDRRKTPNGPTTIDSEGSIWRVTFAEVPKDWVSVKDQLLCSGCANGLEKATDTYLKPPEPPLPEMKAAPIMQHGSVIVAPKVWEKPVQNRTPIATLSSVRVLKSNTAANAKPRAAVTVSKTSAAPQSTSRRVTTVSTANVGARATVTKSNLSKPTVRPG